MKILMVCLGNICRSPLAHGILEHKSKQYGLNITVDSAGTNGFHDGEQPDRRSMTKALEYEIDISDQCSRQITKKDLKEFDLIYVMDSSNFQNVRKLTNDPNELNKIKMIMNECDPNKNINVPDPYYGGEEGFENVYEMLDRACEAIITNHLK